MKFLTADVAGMVCVFYVMMLSVAEVYTASVVGEQIWSVGGMLMTGENWSTWIRNLPQCHFVHQEFHMDWNGAAF